MRRTLWLILASLFALAPGFAEARWLAAESPQFIVYSDGSEDTLRTFTDQLERYDALLRLLTDAKKPFSGRKLRVYLVGSQKALLNVSSALGPNVYGFYVASTDGVVAVAVRNTADETMMSGQAVLFHEYTHHFMAQYFPGAYPSWYQEGFAEYCSTAKFKGDTVEYGNVEFARYYWVVNEKWMPIEQLFDPQTTQVLSNQMFYPEAWLATHYLMRHPAATAQLMTYLAAMRRGEDSPTAFKAAFGMDFDAFQKILSHYAQTGMTYTVIKGLKIAPSSITVTVLPASSDKLLLDQARAIIGPARTMDSRTTLAEIRADAAAYPDDPLSLHTLALAEIRFGDPAAADAPLDHLLAAVPDDEEGLYLKGLRYVTSGWADEGHRQDLFEKARPFLVKAYKLDDSDYRALHLYAVTHEGTREPLSENTVNAFVLAHQIAPQVEEISFDAAVALMWNKEYDSAAVLLSALAYSPHPGSKAESVLHLLAQAKAHEPPTFDVLDLQKPPDVTLGK